jgi:hypothetical protein
MLNRIIAHAISLVPGTWPGMHFGGSTTASRFDRPAAKLYKWFTRQITGNRKKTTP